MAPSARRGRAASALLLAALRRGRSCGARRSRRHRRHSASRSAPRASARRAGRLHCSTLASSVTNIGRFFLPTLPGVFFIGRRGRLASIRNPCHAQRALAPPLARGRIATATAPRAAGTVRRRRRCCSSPAPRWSPRVAGVGAAATVGLVSAAVLAAVRDPALLVAAQRRDAARARGTSIALVNSWEPGRLRRPGDARRAPR